MTASALCGVGFLVFSLGSILCPYDLDQYEGNLFLPAIRLVSGQPIYGPNVVLQEPFVFATYGPVYYALHGLLLKLTGPVFWPGRLISFLATAGSGLLIYRAVQTHGRAPMAGIVAVTAFLMMPPTFVFGALQRVDALGVALSLLSVAILLQPLNPQRLYIAGGAAALAVLTKPTLLAAGLAVTAHLLLTRRPRELARFLVAGAAVFLVVSVLLSPSGNGGYSFYLESTNTGYALQPLVLNLRGLAGSHTAFACAVLAFAILPTIGPPGQSAASQLLPIYLAVTGVLGLVGAARTGSNVNYFYDFTTVLALLAGVAFGRLLRTGPAVVTLGAAVLLSASLLTELLLYRPSSFKGRILDPLRKASLYKKVVEDLARFVPPTEPVLSDYQDLVLRAGRPIYFNDRHMYRISATASMRSCLQSYLDEKRLAALVTVEPLLIPGYIQVEGYKYRDPDSISGVYSRGPILHLRSDLWESAKTQLPLVYGAE